MLKSVLVLCLCACASAHSADRVTKEEKLVIRGTSCVPKISCNVDPTLPKTLKEVGFWLRDHQFSKDSKLSGETNFRNSILYAWYETLTPEFIEDFAFVQYVHGCMFSTKMDADGLVTAHYNVVRKRLGERQAYVHLDWEVDSDKSDPIYDADPDRVLRHYFMEWNLTPDQFPQKSGKFYGEDPPKGSRLFIRPHPLPPAHLEEDGVLALNHSLEFRTCLYRTTDIPHTSDGRIIPGAISCFEWSSSHIYDHVARAYTSPRGIAKACMLPKRPDFLKPW